MIVQTSSCRKAVCSSCCVSADAAPRCAARAGLIPNLTGTHRLTCAMSYPVVAFESCGGINLWQFVHCATASLGASFLTYWQFRRCYGPPRRDHYIPSVMCQRWPPSPGLLCAVHQIKCRQRAGVESPHSDAVCACVEFEGISSACWRLTAKHSSRLLEIKWGLSNLYLLCVCVTLWLFSFCNVFNSVGLRRGTHTDAGWENSKIKLKDMNLQQFWRFYLRFCETKNHLFQLFTRVCVWISAGGEKTTILMIFLSLMVWVSMQNQPASTRACFCIHLPPH